MIKINAGGIVNVSNRLQDLQQKAIAKALPEIAEAYRSSIDFNFRKGGRYGEGLFGGGTRKWKISYRAKEQQGQTLVDTRRLANSIVIATKGKRIVIGTNTKYAAIHQYGGIIRAKTKRGLLFNIGGKFYMKKSVKIPARPFIVLQDSDLRLTREIILTKMQKP